MSSIVVDTHTMSTVTSCLEVERKALERPATIGHQNILVNITWRQVSAPLRRTTPVD